jgi:hypothetical protein
MDIGWVALGLTVNVEWGKMLACKRSKPALSSWKEGSRLFSHFTVAIPCSWHQSRDLHCFLLVVPWFFITISNGVNRNISASASPCSLSQTCLRTRNTENNSLCASVDISGYVDCGTNRMLKTECSDILMTLTSTSQFWIWPPVTNVSDRILCVFWAETMMMMMIMIEFLATDPEVRARFPALPDYLRSSGSGTGSNRSREYNWGATSKKS